MRVKLQYSLLQVGDFVGNRVGKVAVVEPGLVDLAPLANHNSSGDTYNSTIVVDIANDYAPGADTDLVADFDIAEDFRAATDDDIIPERWMSFALYFAGPAESYALKKGYIIADNGRLSYNDTHTVVYKEPFTDLRAGVYLDTRKISRYLAD